MTSQTEVPKDIGLVMGSRKLKYLENSKEKNEDEIIALEVGLELCRALTSKIDEEIKKEKEKFK